MENFNTTTTTVQEFDAYIESFINFWAPCTCARCGCPTSWEVCFDCVASLEEEDEALVSESIPASCEVVEAFAHEMEIVSLLGESEQREWNLLGAVVRNLTGTIQEERQGICVLGKLQRFNLWRELHAARTRLSELWRVADFEFTLDQQEIFA